MSDTLVCDIETYPGFLLVAFKRLSDGAVRTFEWSDRCPDFDADRVRRIMLQNRIITFNGEGFDVPLIFYACGGPTLAEVKSAADRIINGNVRKWDVQDLLGVRVPRLDHIDLIEPQPNAFASLKTLNGRLHGRRMQDLPYPPDTRPTHDQMDELTRYCINDLDATALLFEALAEPIALREAMGEQYGLDLRSKSDAQMGEAIIKRRVEQISRQKVQRVETPAGTTFPFRIPDWLKVEHPDLRAIVERLRAAEFTVQHDGKVHGPDWLDDCELVIGDTTYSMGIGGLHSTEANRAVHSDYAHQLLDFDVASYYPAIILNSGLYPRSLGRDFLEVFRQIRDERVAAKRSGDKTGADGLKIALNGCFGKLGSRYSILYAPHLMIAITIGGQMALLMLIDRAERAGIPVVSANTDGVVFRCPRQLQDRLTEIVREWEAETGFELESTPYRSLYSRSVNSYIAVKEDGGVKRKGSGLGNPRAEGDMRAQLMNNPGMNVCSDAVVALLTDGTPLEQTIRVCTDIRDFVTVVNVRGGAVWRGEYLGKVVRYVWSVAGEPIFYQVPHPSTGNHKKVPKTDGCRPVMELPDELPADLDYDRYIAAARDILVDVGGAMAPVEVKVPRVLKRYRAEWLALSLAA